MDLNLKWDGETQTFMPAFTVTTIDSIRPINQGSAFDVEMGGVNIIRVNHHNVLRVETLGVCRWNAMRSLCRAVFTVALQFSTLEELSKNG